MFDNKLQFNVFLVLLLLGEAWNWKVIWGRFRSSRSATDWRHWIFAISPGWAPLAFTVFSKLNGLEGPSNLIFTAPPPEAIDSGLILTHLSSGASHPATNPVLQNIWKTWKQSPRRAQRPETVDGGYNVSKETGFVDVEIDALQLRNNFGLTIQLVYLVSQLIIAVIAGAVFKRFTYEPIIALVVAFAGQLFLLIVK